jgi:hypothetical protein
MTIFRLLVEDKNRIDDIPATTPNTLNHGFRLTDGTPLLSSEQDASSDHRIRWTLDAVLGVKPFSQLTDELRLAIRSCRTMCQS